MRFIIRVSLAALLAGCASPQEIAQRNAAAQAAAQAADDGYCASIGAAPGTPNYTQCRLTLLQRRDQQAAADAAQQAAASQALLVTGANILAAANQPVYAPAPVMPTRCRSVYVGNTLQTVCQ